MDQLNIKPHTANREEDPIVLVVNLQTGSIKEVPCGPRNTSCTNGDRPLVWDKHSQAAVVPKSFARSFIMYRDFCASEVNNKPNRLTREQGLEYFTEYSRYIARRGFRGATRPMEKPDLHPAIVVNPRGVTEVKSPESPGLTAVLERLRRLEGENADEQVAVTAELQARAQDALTAKIAELEARAQDHEAKLEARARDLEAKIAKLDAAKGKK